MTEKEFIEMAERKMDGELTSAEQAELENHLRHNPEAAQSSKEWNLIRMKMEQERLNFTDIDLKNDILKKINMEMYKQPPGKDEIVIVRSFWSQPAFKFGLTFVLGVFAGFMIFSFLKVDFKGSGSSTDELKGTFFDSRSFDNMKTADVLQYESAFAKAVCNVRYSAKIVEMRIDLSSTNPVKTTIEFDYSDFAVLNLQSVSVNQQSSAMASANSIQIYNVGDNRFVIQLYNKNNLPHNISFKILQNDSPIYQNSIQVNKE